MNHRDLDMSCVGSIEEHEAHIRHILCTMPHSPAAYWYFGGVLQRPTIFSQEISERRLEVLHTELIKRLRSRSAINAR